MPTDDERREVARKLRGAKYSRYSWERSLYDAIGTDLETSGSDMLDRIADLIEPEQERSCHNKAVWYGNFICDECGCRVYTENDGTDDDVVMPREWNYCPNCRAKVMDE